MIRGLSYHYLSNIHRYYVGLQPRIAISDVDLAKDIMVKEFDNFIDRGFLVSEQYTYRILPSRNADFVNICGIGLGHCALHYVITA